MGYPIGTNVFPLPVFDQDTLAANQGTDAIYIGTRRDNLKPLGFQIQPLAYVTLKAGISYFAVANSGSQELDFLPGADAFAPSPQQVITVLNAAALAAANAAALPTAAAIGAAVPVPPSAAAIGVAVAAPSAVAIGGAVPQPAALATAANAAGSRLVDNLTVSNAFTWGAAPAPSTLAMIDCSQAMSFAMHLNTKTTTALGMVSINFNWYDSTGTILLISENWQFSGGPAPGIDTWLQDRCLSPKLQLEYVGILTGGPILANGLAGTFTTSSRPCDRPRVTDTNCENSGALIDTGNVALAAGASSAQFVCGITTGRIAIALNGVSATNRARGGFGFSGSHGLTLVSPPLAAANNPAATYEFPAMNAPFQFILTNIGAGAGSCSLVAWTTGD